MGVGPTAKIGAWRKNDLPETGGARFGTDSLCVGLRASYGYLLDGTSNLYSAHIEGKSTVKSSSTDLSARRSHRPHQAIVNPDRFLESLTTPGRARVWERCLTDGQVKFQREIGSK